MNFTFAPLIAHGALGIWDEIIFLSVVVIFITFMGISWVRSRFADPQLDDDSPAPDLKREFNDPDPEATSASGDRFKLE